MGEYPALKNTFDNNWLATWLSDKNAPPLKTPNWENLELKERINALATHLNNWLPKQTTEKNIDLLDSLLSKHQPWKKGNMKYWPIFSWVELFGAKTPNQSLAFLGKYTHMFTAEFAVRPIIEHHEAIVFDFFTRNINNSDEHIRRWISEGARPRLPWGKQVACLKQNLIRNLELINQLIDDESAYVRKSAANHLNDVYREDKKIAIKYATSWWKHNTPHSKWIVKHGLRSAIKDGYQPALALLGFSAVTISNAKLTIANPAIPFNGSVHFSFEGKLNKPSDVIIDYAIHFIGANKKPRIKVFKLKTLLTASEINLEKNHSFKPISTRKYYPGTHTVAILVNGQTIASKTFELLAP